MTNLPPVRRARELGVNAERAFEALTAEIGAWWPLSSHSCSEDPQAELHFVDDDLVETTADGSRHVWGEVLRWEPPFGLVMTWHPGREASDAVSEVELRVTALSKNRSLVEVFHRGWERLADPEGTRSAYENGWPLVVDRFTNHLNEETEPELWHLLSHTPGPHWQAGTPPAQQEGIEQHFAFLGLLDGRGLLVAGGPLPASPGAGQTIVRGIDTETAVRMATSEDGAVISGLLNVAVTPWLVVSQPSSA